MSPTAATRTAPSARTYNPNPIRRRVRHYDDGAAEFAAFITKSFTRTEGEHIIHISGEDFTAHCTCEDATYRKRRQSIVDLSTCCKHVIRACILMEREGTLAALPERQAQFAAQAEAEEEARRAQWEAEAERYGHDNWLESF